MSAPSPTRPEPREGVPAIETCVSARLAGDADAFPEALAEFVRCARA